MLGYCTQLTKVTTVLNLDVRGEIGHASEVMHFSTHVHVRGTGTCCVDSSVKHMQPHGATGAGKLVVSWMCGQSTCCATTHTAESSKEGTMLVFHTVKALRSATPLT